MRKNLRNGGIVALFTLVAGVATWWLLLRPIRAGQVVLNGKGGRVVYDFSESPVWFCLALILEGLLVAGLWWAAWVWYHMSFRTTPPPEPSNPDDPENSSIR